MNTIFMKKTIKTAKCFCPIALPPILTLSVFFITFLSSGMFPFGNGCMAWCDMNQQSLPLLMNLKDILSGKDSLLFSMHNAGGMNFWGVFCFFLSNPFSFIAVLIPKESMIFAMNIIVAIKLALCSLTAAIYFRLCKKNIDSSLSVPLSMMYALCGYGMLFFQNLMWLDIMYLFPLLMAGLHKLTREKKAIMFTVTLTASVVMNFYISFMVILFIILYMGIYLLDNRKDVNCREICLKFIGSSSVSALLSAVIWYPSLFQVMQSARLKSIHENLISSKFLSNYETVLPLLFCTGLILAVFVSAFVGRQKLSKERRGFIILFLLTLVPFFIEPINIMWHTGDYMAFPARYGFITVFLGIICCGDFISDISEKEDTNIPRLCISALISAVLIYGYYFISKRLIDKDFKTLTKYTAALWGDKSSFSGLARLFILSAVCYLAIYIMYRKRFMMKQVFVVSITMLCFFEGMNSIRLYMVSPAENNPKRTEDFAALIDMHDKINDDSFYRVGLNQKSAYYNTAGALGYLSINHYTSLTDRNYMELQRNLGYTTVWMKTGGMGGTELTDSLYSIKYHIIEDTSKESLHTVYSTDKYVINQSEYSLGLGVLCKNSLSDRETIPEGLTRAEIQQYLFENIFGSDKRLITEYNCNEELTSGAIFSEGRYKLKKDAELIYSFYVNGRQSLYADCYADPQTEDAKNSYNALKVKVNGKTKVSAYPTADSNGLLKLGEFENENVVVRINCEKEAAFSSFGIFGLDLDLLSEAVDNTACADLQYSGGKIYGSIKTGSPVTCLLAVPYNDGLRVRINGTKVPCRRVFSDLTAIDLEKGISQIEITFIPTGFIAGALLSSLGLALFVMYIILQKKIKPYPKAGAVCTVLTGSAAALCIAIIYIYPLIINFLSFIT